MITKDLQIILNILKNGEVILYPTDTIWGIGCDATNEKAIARVNAIKKRPQGQPLTILVSNVEMLKNYVEEVPVFIYKQLNLFTKPVTIIYPHAKNLPVNLLADDYSVGIRIVKDYPFLNQVITLFNKPLVSTSANLAGQPTPQQFDDIPLEIIRQVDYVVPRQYEMGGIKQASDIYKISGNELIKVR